MAVPISQTQTTKPFHHHPSLLNTKPATISSCSPSPISITKTQIRNKTASAFVLPVYARPHLQSPICKSTLPLHRLSEPVLQNSSPLLSPHPHRCRTTTEPPPYRPITPQSPSRAQSLLLPAPNSPPLSPLS